MSPVNVPADFHSKGRKSPLKYPIRCGSFNVWLTEEGLQHFTVADWMRFRGISFIHVPNEGKRTMIEGAKLKLLGLHPGASDFLIFTPSPLNGKPTAIEMKAPKGAKATPNQEAFLRDLRGHGWNTTVAFGSDQAIEYLTSLNYHIRGE